MPQGEMRRVTNYPREVRRAKRKGAGLELGRPGCFTSGLIVLLYIPAGLFLSFLFPGGGFILGWGFLGALLLLCVTAVEADLTPNPWLNFYPLSVIYLAWITLGSMILHFLDALFPLESAEESLVGWTVHILGLGWVPLFFPILLIAMAFHARNYRDNGLDEL